MASPAQRLPSLALRTDHRLSGGLVRALCALGAVSMSLVILQTAFGPATAAAQEWLADRERAEGRGIRLGDLELHPGIGTEVGYDSNVFYQDQDPQGSGILRVTPHFYLSTLGEERSGEDGEERQADPPSIRFRGGVSANVYHYFATKAKTNVGGDLDLRLEILPDRPFSVVLFENFGRSVRPFAEAAGALDYGRDENTVGTEVQFGTPGRILRGRVGYSFGLDFFEGDDYRFANNLTHEVNAGASWRFFPQTAFLYDFRTQFTGYTDDALGGALRPLLSDNIRMRSRFGINGAFTNKFSLLVLAGYGAGFYGDGDEYDSLVGQLEARWQLSPGTRMSIGYDRDFHKAYVGGFTRRDRGYANVQLLLGGAFLLGVEGSAGLYDFGATLSDTAPPTPLGAGGATDRSDVRVTGSLFAEYRVTDWLGFNGTLSYTGDFTDFEYQRPVGGTTMIDPAEYQKFEAWFGVRAFY